MHSQELTLGISVNPTPTSHTEALTLLRDPLTSMIAHKKNPDDHRHLIPHDHTEPSQEINTSAPYQVQTGVCPQSRPTFTQQTAIVRATQGRTATAPAAVIPHHFLDAENAISEGKEDPSHSSWASRSETPARVPDTNAPADLSPRNGTSAILGQHGASPDRDDNERTRPVTTPSVRSRGLSANYSPHSPSCLAPMMDRLRTSATMSYSGSPPRFFPNGHFHYLRRIYLNAVVQNNS